MATVSGLSLESYVQIYKALIKTSDKVQAVTPIEECYYKVQDLRQLLSVHGLSASKFNRTELLQAIKGKPLVNPFSQWLEGTDVDIQHLPPATAATCSTAVDPELVTGADLSALGWVEAGARILTQPIEQLQIDMLAGFAVIPGENDSNMLAGLAGAGLSAPMAGPSQQQQWQHETAAGLLRFTQQPVQEGHRATSDAGCPWSAEIPQQLQTAVAAEGMHVCEGWRTAKRAKTTVSSPLLQQHPPRTTPTAPLQAAVTDGPRAGQQQGPTTAAAVAANERALMIQNAAAGSSEQACSRLQPSRLQQRQRLHLELTHMLQQQHDGLQLEQQLGSGLNFSCGSFQQGVPAPQQQQEHQQHLAEQEDNANETEAEDDDEAQLMGDLTAVAAANPLVELLQQAGLPAAMPGASQQHAHQLLKQLQLFAAAGAVASQEVLPTAPAAAPATLGSAFSCDSNALLGRHVGFVLTEEMLVAGTKNMQLTFPAGVYEGRVIKYLGSACHPELCEPTCPGVHQHYRARILPPQLPDNDQVHLLKAEEVAASVAQAHAAASGRPVQLILDLHPSLRCDSLGVLLRLDTSKLQDAWILLMEQEEQPSASPEPEAKEKQPARVAASSAAARGRGRGGGRRGRGSARNSNGRS